ncbi:MAG TPA: tRNA pseudouridine(38-40) synthase TruA [Clostridiaceae bacterium]
MKNIKLIIEFDGTNYNGWQIQKNGIGVQQVVEKAIKKLTGKAVKLIGSSRTDAGVHAKGYVANFLIEATIPGCSFMYAINSFLPKDISIIDSEEVDIDFNARFHCRSKTYSYSIINRKTFPAMSRYYYCHIKQNLNIDLMKEASRYFLGTHDFSAFKNNGGSRKNPLKTIYKLDIEKVEDKIIIYVTGSGFLYNMVRIIVGTLIDVGDGKISPEKTQAIIESRDRNEAGMTAQALGLCLEKVYY